MSRWVGKSAVLSSIRLDWALDEVDQAIAQLHLVFALTLAYPRDQRTDGERNFAKCAHSP